MSIPNYIYVQLRILYDAVHGGRIFGYIPVRWYVQTIKIKNYDILYCSGIKTMQCVYYRYLFNNYYNILIVG